MIKGVDVSSWQGKINWHDVAVSGVKFAILRAGYGRQDVDNMFEENFKAAKAEGLEVGVYWYSYADSVQRAKEEAKKCLHTLAGRYLELPVFFDYEYEKNVLAISTPKRTECAKAFCEMIKAAGYVPGIYASLDFLENKLEMGRLPYVVWCAQYAGTCQFEGWDLWQHSSSGYVPGIDGKVDLNWMQEPESVVKVCSASLPILKNGMRGEAVMALQSLLNLHGASLKIDGVCGKLTDAAVREFQKANGLKIDGIVGKITWAALIGG